MLGGSDERNPRSVRIGFGHLIGRFLECGQGCPAMRWSELELSLDDQSIRRGAMALNSAAGVLSTFQRPGMDPRKQPSNLEVSDPLALKLA
jgi:hypothetical protein